MGKIMLNDVEYSSTANNGVTSIKGNNESEYRTGDVNLTPENIGAVNKNGDTMTGTLRLLNGSNVNESSGGTDSDGYVNIARIKINEAFVDCPIFIQILSKYRNDVANVIIKFDSASNADPSLDVFQLLNSEDYGIYLHKRTTSTWDLYVHKGGAFGYIFINNIYIPNPDNRNLFSISYPNAHVTSKADSWVSPTMVIPAGTVNKVGDTMTGRLQLLSGTTVANSGTGDVSKIGYLRVATLKIRHSWIDNPIVFEIAARGWSYAVTVYIKFSGSSDNNPSSVSFLVDKIPPDKIYLHKRATATWDLYVYKSAGYGYSNTLSIRSSMLGTQGVDAIEIEHPKDVLLDTLPDGVIEPDVMISEKAKDSNTVDGKHASDFVNKAGDSMTGDLAISSGRSNTLNITIPCAGRIDEGINNVQDLSEYKTFLGSYCDINRLWWNIISTRHGNGWNDGHYLGMYLRSKLLDNGDLLWGKQTGSTKGWQEERTLLDSANYKNFCLPLSGGIMKDDVAVIFKSNNGIGTQLEFQGGTYRTNVRPAELILSNGNKKIYIMPNNGANHPTIKIIDTDTNIEYDENVEINSSSIKITDNSTSETLKIGASKIVEENTLLYLGSNNNMFGLMIDGSSKVIFSGSTIASDRYDLGNSTRKYKNIYAQNGIIQTSDRTRKADINSLETQKIQAFINGLNPVSYKMLDGTSGRTHYGLIAQDIEELMNTLNMDSLDFAGFIKSPKKVIKYKDENGKKLKNPIEEVIEGEYDYSLRYDEFIAPLIKVVQEQQKAIDNQQQQITQLKNALEKANL